MASSLPIGDFSRATHMSIKTLRHYHRVGLLEPADVDPLVETRFMAATQRLFYLSYLANHHRNHHMEH